jgi:hypothetical protein
MNGRPGMSGIRRIAAATLLSLPLSGCAVGGALFRGLVLRSGAPPREEIRRMQARRDTMLRQLPDDGTLVVLPVGVLSQRVSYRRDAAEDLASALRKAGIPGARAGERVYALPYPRQPNQAWIFWKRFRALAESVGNDPKGEEADYVLLVDVLGGVNDDGTLRGIGGIHAMVTTAGGALAYGELRNSHHPVFRRIQPHSMMDAIRVVVEDLLAARQALPAADPS